MSSIDSKSDMAKVEHKEHQPSHVSAHHHELETLDPVLEHERHLGVFKTARIHWRALLCCGCAFTAAGLFGYDSVVNGASLAMPSFFLYYGKIGPTGPYLPSIWTSLWSALSYLAQAIGALTVGFFMDLIGRKWTGSASAALTIAGTAVQFVSHTRGVLLAGKMISGFGIGAALATGTTYASEIAPLKLRAPVQQAIVLFTVVMYAVALGIIRAFVPDVREQSFRTVFAIQWAVGVLSAIAFAVVPESPVWLISRGRRDAARKALTRIYGADQAIDARMQDIIKTVEEEQAEKQGQTGGYLDCFKGTDRKRTLTAVFIYCAVQIGGAPLLTQNILILIIAGLPAVHAFDIGVGGFALAIVVIFSSWFVLEHFRRQNAFLVGCVVNFVMMVAIGSLYFSTTKGALWAAAVLMNLLIVLQTTLIQSMGYPIAAEVSSYRLRGKTIAIASIAQALMNWLISFIVPYLYNVDSANLGLRSAYVFAGTSIIWIVGAWYLIPDTTDMTAAEIDHAYENKIAPRSFRKDLDARRMSVGSQFA